MEDKEKPDNTDMIIHGVGPDSVYPDKLLNVLASDFGLTKEKLGNVVFDSKRVEITLEDGTVLHDGAVQISNQFSEVLGKGGIEKLAKNPEFNGWFFYDSADTEHKYGYLGDRQELKYKIVSVEEPDDTKSD